VFFIFGITPKTKRYGAGLRYCDVHRGRAWHELMSMRSWFNLFFFLKLFPIGRERLLAACTECGVTYELSRGEFDTLVAQTQNGSGQPDAAAIYRTTPYGDPPAPTATGGSARV
jgi:hypothetical protein